MSGDVSLALSAAAPRRWWIAAVFCLAGVVSYSDRLVLSALVDLIRADLGLTDSEIGLLQGAAFAIVYVIAGLPLGWLADRTHRVRLLVIGALVWTLGTFACGLAHSFGTFYLARMLVGIGEATLAPTAISIIADAFPAASRGRAIGIVFVGFVVGGPLGIAAGELLLDIGQRGGFSQWSTLAALQPWRQVLVIAGVIGIVIPLMVATVREPPRATGTVARPPVREIAMRFVNARGRLLPLYSGMALLSLGDYALLSWLPASITRRFELSATQVGLTFGTVCIVTGVLAALGGGGAVDWARRSGAAASRRLLAAFAIAAAGGAALIASDSVTAVWIGLAMWNGASMAAGTSGMAALQDAVADDVRGISTSLVSFCNTLLGLGLGPVLVALLTEHLFGDPARVGQSIAIVCVPAALVAMAAFLGGVGLSSERQVTR